MLSPLPIEAVLPELIDKLRCHPNLVLQAPTGTGKTTRVPPTLLDAGLAGAGRLLLLEPRRVAARAAARRMASERGERVGQTIGYQVRFERQCGPQTRILVVTPGILLRQLHDDPFLESTAAVLFDEFHERSLESDLALGMVRLVQQTVRPELKIVVMSATLDVETIAAYLGDCPRVQSEGRLYPVAIRYGPRRDRQPWPEAAAEAAERLLPHTEGDLLVFLPGWHEIRQTAKHLEPLASATDLAVLPLHGDLPAEQQDAALLRSERRRIVLATNVAETSVTVEGITGVVDTGLARQLIFDPAVGLDRLQLMPIAKASADQRAGRAGRTRPGICVRLWSEASHRGRPEQTEPEIRRVDLAGALLHVLGLGEKDLQQFPWLEKPKPAALEQALLLLRRLGALEGMDLTELGEAMLRLPVHPRLGRLLLAGMHGGRLEQIALAAALLAERDPFQRQQQPASDMRRAAPSRSDIVDRVEMLEAFEQRTLGAFTPGQLNRAASRLILRARDQLIRITRAEGQRMAPGADHAPEQSLSEEKAICRALLTAFPDRVVRRREPGSPKGVMVGGRGVRLAPASGVTEGELFLAVEVDAGEREALVRQASAIERDWLPAHSISRSIEVHFDPKSERVVAVRRISYEDLVLEESSAALPKDDSTARILAEAAAQQLDRVLPLENSPAGQYLTRIRCLRQWLPEAQLPALDDDELRDLLIGLCTGLRAFAELRSADWLVAIQNRLTHSQRQTVERDAPERLQVPSGSWYRLQYERGRPPVLAVRIQELFGLHETPRIARGRIAVLLHLLAPNYRPQQVTDDLASFWTNTYPQVRKDLRARYPKHAWPEDPWTAVARRKEPRGGDKKT